MSTEMVCCSARERTVCAEMVTPRKEWLLSCYFIVENTDALEGIVGDSGFQKEITA